MIKIAGRLSVEDGEYHKNLSGVVALDHVSLRVKKGTVHAVMGRMEPEVHFDESAVWDLPGG